MVTVVSLKLVTLNFLVVFAGQESYERHELGLLCFSLILLFINVEVQVPRQRVHCIDNDLLWLADLEIVEGWVLFNISTVPGDIAFRDLTTLHLRLDQALGA